jgi:hypothetical protein
MIYRTSGLGDSRCNRQQHTPPVNPTNELKMYKRRRSERRALHLFTCNGVVCIRHRVAPPRMTEAVSCGEGQGHSGRARQPKRAAVHMKKNNIPSCATITRAIKDLDCRVLLVQLEPGRNHVRKRRGTANAEFLQITLRLCSLP